MTEKLDKIVERYDFLTQEISKPEVIANNGEWKKLVKEHSGLTPIVECYEQYKKASKACEDASLLAETESDREMAELTERRYKESEGKKMQYLGVVQHGKLLEYDPKLHAGIVMDFVPEADGLTFHLKGVFTDSLRSSFSDDHASGEIHVDRICGPAEKVNDTTFAVRFYRMGMYNKRRTNDIWLLASQKGDTHYKSAVQQLTMRIPYRNRAGRRQHILFPGLDDVEAGTTAVELHAVSDCGLPVYYYVKEGPAEIVGGKVMLSELPPRAKYPVKVTVVAWQYGIGGKVATAEPVERSFYIKK